MNQTVVTRLMQAIEIAYKEHLPQWEFPNKEIWIQEEKEQIKDAWIDGDNSDCLSEQDSSDFAEQYYNETFNTTKTSTHSGLTSLDEHNSNAWSTQVNMYSNEPRPNGIACPECGNELMDTNPMMTLTSHPAKKNVHCSKCEYKGYRIV
jgi:hypothetical protein